MLEVKIKKRLAGFNLDVSFAMDEGILSIMGPSGSGKTLTLQCIAGLVRPDEGYVRLNGRVLFDSASAVNLPARVRKVGFVFQNYALFPHITVRENIAYGIRNLPRGERDRVVEDLLARMNIQRLGDRYPGRLSSGEQQRVAMARALAPRPEILLLDEPFSALDLMNKEGLQLELLSVQRSFGGSTLFVTHDFSQGYSLGSRMAIYESGRIVQCDAKDRVLASPANRTVARLAGFRNLLSGRVSRLSDPEVFVAVPGLESEIRGFLNKETRLDVNQPVTIGVQPSRVRVVEYAGENAFPVVVDQVVDGLGEVSYFFRLEPENLCADYLVATCSRSSELLVREGESCFLHLPPDSVVIIPDAASVEIPPPVVRAPAFTAHRRGFAFSGRQRT